MIRSLSVLMHINYTLSTEVSILKSHGTDVTKITSQVLAKDQDKDTAHPLEEASEEAQAGAAEYRSTYRCPHDREQLHHLQKRPRRLQERQFWRTFSDNPNHGELTC